MFQSDTVGKDGELTDAQKIKIANTLSEYIQLNKTKKPIIFNMDGGVNDQSEDQLIIKSKITR